VSARRGPLSVKSVTALLQPTRLPPTDSMAWQWTPCFLGAAASSAAGLAQSQTHFCKGEVQACTSLGGAGTRTPGRSRRMPVLFTAAPGHIESKEDTRPS
jgi:hypothetical protein